MIFVEKLIDRVRLNVIMKLLRNAIKERRINECLSVENIPNLIP